MLSQFWATFTGAFIGVLAGLAIHGIYRFIKNWWEKDKKIEQMLIDLRWNKERIEKHLQKDINGMIEKTNSVPIPGEFLKTLEISRVSSFLTIDLCESGFLRKYLCGSEIGDLIYIFKRYHTVENEIWLNENIRNLAYRDRPPFENTKDSWLYPVREKLMRNWGILDEIQKKIEDEFPKLKIESDAS